MEILPLEILVREYKARLYMLGLKEPKKFVDITHNGLGKICTMYYYPRIKQFKLEQI